MTFDSASMDLEKAMGRVAESTTTIFALQCVASPFEKQHAKRMVQFLRKHAIVECSLFRVDVGQHAEATAILCRYLRSATSLHTIRLRSVHLRTAVATRQVCLALAEHGRLVEIVLDAAGLVHTTDALVPLLERHGNVLRKLDLSCETWPFGPTGDNLARGLQHHCRMIQHLRLNNCQLTDEDAAPLLRVLHTYGSLTHLELRKNQFRATTLHALAVLLSPSSTTTMDTSPGEAASPPWAAAATITSRPALQLLDLAGNPGLFLPEQPPAVNDDGSGDHPDAPPPSPHAGLDAFCAALAGNTFLRTLVLRNTGVHAYLLERMAHAMRRNGTLSMIDLCQTAPRTNASRPPPSFWHCMVDWKGVEILELDCGPVTAPDPHGDVDGIVPHHPEGHPDDFVALVLPALHRNTSLVAGTSLLEGLPTAEHRTAIKAVFRRNHWWKRARTLLSHNASLWYDSGRPGAWMHVLRRFQSHDSEIPSRGGAGHTATFHVLRERLPFWLESRAEHERGGKPSAMVLS